MSRVFLAGAAGAIGRRLTPLLLDARYEVYGTTGDPERAAYLERTGVHAVVVDVFDPAALFDRMATVQPEIVMHQLTDLPQRVEDRTSKEGQERNGRIRTEGTQNLIAAALKVCARRVIASSAKAEKT